MLRQAAPLSGSGTRGHLVQFYDSVAFLLRTLAEFVGAGLGMGHSVLIVATDDHLSALRALLEESAIDVARACGTDQLTLLDAGRTMALFLVHGEPDARLFEEHIGGLVRGLKERRNGRPLRVFGEMVHLLCEAGNPGAALRLEDLWNELGKEEEFVLLCGYGLDVFGSTDHGAVFAEVCASHSGVLPAESFSQIEDDDRRLREVSVLQQRAKALETEAQRRAEAERALRESQVELNDFFENAVEGIHRVGPDGIILWANKAEMEMLGYTADEYIGQHVGRFHADENVICDILARLSRGETLRDYEARLRCKDGSLRHVLIHSNVYWLHGKFVHTRCFTRDITDRKRAEEEVRRKKEELERLVRELENINRVKDEFLATVSHELRTPLNAVMGWARMLRSNSLPAEKREHALEVIERNANAQAQLIEDLLDVSRIISGKLRLDIDTVDVPTLLDHAVEGVRPAAGAKAIQLRLSVDRGAGRILADPNRLQQIIWNLLTNAVKFTPRGGLVEVSLRRRQAAIEIVVTDTGEGIAADFLPHVFERFRQADASSARKHGGLGLGLTIVRHLVELHGGTIKAHSEGPGKGASFTVCLPISPDESIAADHPPALRLAAARSGAPFRQDLKGIRVLVVDDEPDARELLSEILSACHATVWTAASAADAIEMLRRHRPSVVVSDIAMPGEDGYSLITKIRSLAPSEGGRTPAVALTAYARFEDRTKALMAGFNMHVPKPVEPAELLAALASLAALLTEP